MIVQDEFIKRLRSSFDLNIYEAKIWTALLSKGIATAGELSDISDVPRSRTYDVLESLEKRGFVVMKLGKPIKYIAVKPEEVVKRVKKSMIDEANINIKTLESIEGTDFYRELALLHKNGIVHIDPTTISGSLRGRTNIYNHISSMLEGAQKSVVIVTTQTGFSRKLDYFDHILKKLANKGVKIKIAAPISKDMLLSKSIKNVLGHIEIRHANKISARFIAVDSKQLIFMLNSDDNVHENYDVGIWINSPFFVNAVENLFEMNWSRLEKI